MTLTVRGIVAGYGGDPVLHGVDLDVRAGELVSVLGASGSGKTTLLRVAAGLHRPDAGRVLVGGADVTDVSPERRRVGLVPQEGALFAHLDVRGNVGFGLVPTGLAGGDWGLGFGRLAHSRREDPGSKFQVPTSKGPKGIQVPSDSPLTLQ